MEDKNIKLIDKNTIKYSKKNEFKMKTRKIL